MAERANKASQELKGNYKKIVSLQIPPGCPALQAQALDARVLLPTAFTSQLWELAKHSSSSKTRLMKEVNRVKKLEMPFA